MAHTTETAGTPPPPSPPARRDKAERHKRLCDLIQATVDTEGQEDDGQTWAVKPLTEWAELLGVSTKTVSRLIREPPIQMMDTAAELPDSGGSIGGRKRVIALRIGLPAPLPNKEHKLVANIMGKFFRERTGHPVKSEAYGCLIGLAKEWPAGYQVAIFKDCLTDWGLFMAGVKLRQEVEGGKALYLTYASIKMLRRWPHVAADCYLSHLQEKGEGSSAKLPFPYHYK